MNRRRLNAAAAKALRLAVLTNHPPGPERAKLLALVRWCASGWLPTGRKGKGGRVGGV